jgi:hypothetical protein
MDNATAAWLGFLVGLLLACLPLYLLGLLVGLVFKNSDPDERAIYAAGGAWLLTFFISAWGFANGGPMRWNAGLYYIPAGIIPFFMLKRHYWKLWQPDEEGLADTFD